MYKYEFVRVELKFGFWSGGLKPREDYQEIINTYAKNGWRFKQIFAPASSIQGTSSYFELIFEKEI
jgi:hypothetical protein